MVQQVVIGDGELAGCTVDREPPLRCRSNYTSSCRLHPGPSHSPSLPRCRWLRSATLLAERLRSIGSSHIGEVDGKGLGNSGRHCSDAHGDGMTRRRFIVQQGTVRHRSRPYRTLMANRPPAASVKLYVRVARIDRSRQSCPPRLLPCAPPRCLSTDLDQSGHH